MWGNGVPFPCLFLAFGSCKLEVTKVVEYTDRACESSEERRDESENKHGNGKRIWLGAELSWTPRV